jgi:2-oxoglutarate ferredoxin oxidoreductase subunit delta
VSEVTNRGTIVMHAERCKACELCVPACPPKVLRMSSATNEKGYRLPELLPGCTGCTACMLVCPDFVFDVYKYDAAASEDARA